TVSAAAELATQAGLQLVGIEPSLAAMYRFAYPQLHDQASAAFVSIGYAKSEIAILDHGQIRLYRRADIGTDEMIKGRQGLLAAAKAGMENQSGRVMLGEHPEEEEQASEEHISGGINNAKAGTFGVGVKRSIDYFRREFPRATPLNVIYLAANDPDAADLGPWLKQSLDTEVVLCEPAQLVNSIPTVALQMEIPSGLRYSSAIGLALT